MIFKNQPKKLMLEIYLIDPKECGQGVHYARQQPYLLTNTLACQVTMLHSPDKKNSSIKENNHSFTEWANQIGYRKFNQNYYKCIEYVGE